MNFAIRCRQRKRGRSCGPPKRHMAPGAFTLSRVPPGAYVFSAFIDVKPDTLCGTYFVKGDTTRAIAEPCFTLPDTLRLKPGETRKLDPFTLK